MQATFNDLQNHSSSLHGATVRNRTELYRILDATRDRKPFVCQLEGENDWMLMIGIGQDIGFVQHSRIDGDSAYLVAVNPGSVSQQHEGRQQDFEFLCGDTPSPIAKRYILPFETVKHIAAYFLEVGQRDPSICWEDFSAAER